MKHLLSSFRTIVASALLVVAIALPAGAVDPKQSLCEGSGGTWNGTSCDNAAGQPQVTSTFQTVSNLLLFLVGAIAVVMVIIGGIRYVTSNGEQNQISSAKNTILYAVVGLVVAFLAYAIVNFVATQIAKGNT